jgi:mannose-1-phosphate guanylyltransferase
MDLKGFWMDIGQPKDYLTGMCMYLSSEKFKKNNENEVLRNPVDGSYTVIGDTVLCAKSAKIGRGCIIGPNVVIGENVVIGDGVRLQRTAIMSDVTIGSHSWIHSTIIGWNSSVGKWTRLENITVLGEDVHVSDEIYVNGSKILPHKGVSENILHPGEIIM